MELIEKYWYIGAIGLVLLFMFSRRQSSGADVQQLRQGTDTVAMAQIASAEREADESRRYGFAGGLLQYNFNQLELQANTELAKLNIANQIDLAQISANNQSLAANNAYQLAMLQANSNNYANQLQYQLAQYMAQRQYGQQTQSNWLGAITSGVQTLLPYLFGRSTSGGSMNIPTTAPIFGNSGPWQNWPSTLGGSSSFNLGGFRF